MGNKFFCGLKNKSSKSKGKGKKKKLPVPREILSSCEYESDTIDHTSQEILDENFKREITTGIDEHMATIPTAFQVSCFLLGILLLLLSFRLNVIVL